MRTTTCRRTCTRPQKKLCEIGSTVTPGLKVDKPHALVQLATGFYETFATITQILTVLHDFARNRLVIRVERGLEAWDVSEARSGMFLLLAVLSFALSEIGRGFVVRYVRTSITAVGPKTVSLPAGPIRRTPT